MTINDAVTAIDGFLQTYEGGAAKVQVRPSGDDLDVIKIYADLGATKQEPEAWARACEDAIRAALPETKPWRVEIRAEAD